MKLTAASILSPCICYEVIGPDAKIFIFFMLNFKPAFSLSSITLKRPFSSSLPSAIRGGIIYISEVVDIFPGNFDSSLRVIQPNILHDVLCAEVK